MVWQAYRWWFPLQDVWGGGGMKQWHCFSHTLATCSSVQYGNTSFGNILDSHHWLECPFSQQITVPPLLFIRSLSILFGCPIINIHSCHQDMQLLWVGLTAYRPHTGFYSSKLLTCLSYYGIFSNISGMDLGGSIGKCLICIQIRHMVSVNVFS
jgi:hypothetical protein